MKPMLPTLFLAIVSVALTAQSSAFAATAKAPRSSGRVVRVEATIHAPVGEVWRVFTTSRGAEEFFAQKANIDLVIGGPYEIQFDPADERSGTKGLKILSYAPQEMISFQWNAPPQMPEVRNGGTWVVVEMHPVDAYTSRVTITHLGWKDGPEWDRAYAHFERGWSELLSRLEKRFNDGPIDWGAQPMMYKEAKAVGK